MKALVTGADGFVGQWLVQALLGAGHQVTGAVRDGRPIPGRLSPAELGAVRWIPLDLQDAGSIDAVARQEVDWVVHLAAVASSVEAGRDLAVAWAVNAAGTARLVESLAGHANAERVVVVSTGEVYGPGEPRPRRETDPVRPVSPYAATKAAAEI
ncbi:MAG TPA: NAD(P)-dependent oxidoreductase, partial [Gemmatimonadales bacterium]|nr:NAD(P)-dependent oxidoreductase [Gemmatimonadales bacterium]